jgi:hypothetical protein
MVSEAFQRSSSKSTRRANRELQLCRATVQKILHRRMKLHAYKTQILQALEPDDGRRSKAFTSDMLDRSDNDNGFLDRMIFSVWYGNRT